MRVCAVRGFARRRPLSCALQGAFNRAGQAPARVLGSARCARRRGGRSAARAPARPAHFAPVRPSTAGRAARRALRALPPCACADGARGVQVLQTRCAEMVRAPCRLGGRVERAVLPCSPGAWLTRRPRRASAFPGAGQAPRAGVCVGGAAVPGALAERARHTRALCPKSACVTQAAVGAELKKYGLRYDDLLDPTNNLDVNEAMRRLPQEVRRARSGCGVPPTGVARADAPRGRRSWICATSA